MQNLPITELFSDLRHQLRTRPRILIQAPTGSGKSTALPAEMLNWSEITGKIIMLEPRRVATRSIAKFIAKSRGRKVGEEVGYRLRGESKISGHNRLEIVTEGVLTRMIQADPELTGVDVIIFDEVHERHLTTDLGLALALETQTGFREDLKIILMSATLDKTSVAHIMPDAVTLRSEGRIFPVSVEYRAPADSKQYLTTIRSLVLKLINERQDTGDILVFLPGKAEILRLRQDLEPYLPADCVCTPLYGELESAEQDQALKPIGNKRKIIPATNIAESGLTIDGVRIVVDSGLKRQASYNPRTGITHLSTKPVSQASATQRAGRAGRQAQGRCIRIWRQEDHQRRDKFDAPEITQAELVDFALNCAVWGAQSINELPLLTPAPAPNEQTAWQLLEQLEYVDGNRKLTHFGRRAYESGASPRTAHMLLKTRQQDSAGLTALACGLAAVIESDSLPRKGCDIQNYLTVSLSGLKQQARRFMKLCRCRFALEQAVRNARRKDTGYLLALAFPDRIAKKRTNGGYLLANGSGVELPREDALNMAEFLVVADLQQTPSRRNASVFLASQLEPELFDHELSYLLTEEKVAEWDNKTEKFNAQLQTRIGAVVLSTRKAAQPDKALVVNALLKQIEKQGLQILNWSDEVKQLQLKVALAKKYDARKTWPDFSDSELLSNVTTWLSPYLNGITGIRQLKRLNINDILKNSLSWEQQQWLRSELPGNWLMPTGTRAPIRYTDDGRALMSVRLQEALGMARNPSLAQNSLVVTMELLSPARRPIAVTADLAGFWQGSYHELKKEMRGRYPKHLWPDNPLQTRATKFTKKKAGL